MVNPIPINDLFLRETMIAAKAKGYRQHKYRQQGHIFTIVSEI